MAKRRASPGLDRRKTGQQVAGLAAPTADMLPFLGSIRERPADDAVRLTFAAWLERNGYATWGGLMRVQCELEHLPHQLVRTNCILYGREAIERHRLAARGEVEARQLAMIEREFECLQRPDELPWFSLREGERRSFERGLPIGWCFCDEPSTLREEFEANPTQFDWLDTLGILSKRPKIVFDLIDILTRPMRWEFHFDYGSRRIGSYEGWDGLPMIGRLRSLTASFVHDRNAKAHYATVTRLPCPALERFSLFIVGFDSSQLDLLATAPWPALKQLRIGNSRMSGEQFRRLAERMGPQLEGIELVYNEMDAGALIALSRHGLFRGVDFVNNESATLSDESIEALANCPEACNLTKLFLNGSGLTDAGLALIAGSPHLRNVRWLYLDGNRITDEGVEILARSANARNYERISLNRNPIGDRAVRALAQAELASLRELALDEVQMTREGASPLMESAYFGDPVRIFLQHNKMTAEIRRRLRAHFGKRVIM